MSKQSKQKPALVSNILMVLNNPDLDYHQHKAAELLGKDYNGVTKKECLMIKKFHS